MARKNKQDREREICTSVKKLIDDCENQVSYIKDKWRDNYDMFVYGSRNDNKEDWQVDFSVNRLNSSARTVQGRLVNTLVNQPDWYEICPKGYQNKEAEFLAKPLQKIMDYYLENGKFKRHAGTFFLTSLISTGNMYFGWKQRYVQNPEYILQKTEDERRKIQARIAKNVANPDVEPEMSGSEMEDSILKALDEVTAEAQGEVFVEKSAEPYIQVGCLDLMDINHERVYWDPNVMYMEDSLWRAFDYDVNLFELKYLAKLGVFKKEDIDRIHSNSPMSPNLVTQNLRYKNLSTGAKDRKQIVKITIYTGPLMDNGGEILKDKFFAVIANDTIVLQQGDYPYWEPPGRHTPIITASVRQVPYRATGAGIGDNATQIQRIYDSNWQLVCDTFRYGISGINVVNYQNLIDKSQLDEGIYPGMTLHVRGQPKESFERIALTDNIEAQASPVQAMLERAIDTLTGVNELMVGGANPYSRTAAAETNARLNAGNENVNIIALDLEQNFLIPGLKTMFARVLQFGVPELTRNPELQSLLDEDEIAAIQQLSAKGRLEILNQWYSFKIKGFSAQQDKNEAALRDNELLQIANSGGPLSQLINLPAFMKEYFKNRGIKDPSMLLMNDSPLSQVTAENQVLMSGHQIMPAQEDDHQFHIQYQQALAQSPFATPAIQQHVQIHMQYLQQMQLAAQQQGGNSNVQ